MRSGEENGNLRDWGVSTGVVWGNVGAGKRNTVGAVHLTAWRKRYAKRNGPAPLIVARADELHPDYVEMFADATS